MAVSSLGLLLKGGDKHAAHHVLSTIWKAMRAKCNDIHLCNSDADSAIAYAQELLDATLDNTEFLTLKVDH